jgi:hypothetical protein
MVNEILTGFGLQTQEKMFEGNDSVPFNMLDIFELQLHF